MDAGLHAWRAAGEGLAAWAKEGLYGAVEVRDSQLITADPRSFWNGDCLEIFVDTADDKRHREYRGRRPSVLVRAAGR